MNRLQKLLCSALLVVGVLDDIMSASSSPSCRCVVTAFMLPTNSRVPGFRLPFAFSLGGMAEKVLQAPKWPPSWPYNDAVDFAVMDPSDDAIFYDQPRLVYHIDDAAVSALSNKVYKDHLQAGDDVLDICSSWVSHYPDDFIKNKGRVVGLGMNEYELSQNPVLDEFVVKNLNNDPSFPFDDNSFDKVTCVVSIDYLTNPLAVAKEIGRVLRPGGKAIISISNRCFPTKAVQIWLQTNDLEHVFIVGSFFHYAGDGLFEPPACKDYSPAPGMSDPLFVITAVKKEKQ